MHSRVMAWAKANHRTVATRCACKAYASIVALKLHPIGPDRWSLVSRFVCAAHGPMIEYRRIVRYRGCVTDGAPFDLLIDQGSHVVKAPPRTPEELRFDFGIVVLRNLPADIASQGARERATWAADHVAATSRVGGGIRSQSDREALADALYVAASN